MDLMGSGLKPIGVGGARVAEVNQLAKELGCDKQDDLRKLLVDHPASFLLLMTLEGATHDDLHAAVSQGTTVLTLEPLAADLQELSASMRLGVTPTGNIQDTTGRIVFVPAFGQSPGFLSAADPYELLGDRRMVSLTSHGRPEHGSLHARLYDAWLTVLSFTELPETVDASLVSPLSQPPEQLRSLSGSLAAHARMPGSNAAVLEITDNAGHTDRAVRVQGDQAVLSVSDTRYALTNPNGEVLDQADQQAGPDGFADMLAAQWRKILDRPNLTGPITHSQQAADAMACCLACLLSIRTGQPESPAKLLKINR